jgi:NDP-sugar pyrophosphorylase family protein
MSGFGERFRRAGYTTPKPLIPVDGKPIIEHVVGMYPGVTDVVFICNQEHLDTPEYRMREILHSVCPTAQIAGIAPHKLGPVHAVARIFGQLRQDAPIIVNYCDFSCSWDWDAFRRFATETACDGAVICYTGFHPHMLHSTNYAYVRVNDGNRVAQIQEKHPFTGFPMQEYASSGAYYFRNAALMREAFEETSRRNDLLLNGEYYVSLAYRPLLEKNKDIRVFTLDKFCQWGTPEDLREYECHMRYKKAEAAMRTPPAQEGAVLIPLAGMGSRFAKEGYKQPKPLVPVNGRPMVLKAWEALPRCKENRFILRKDMSGAVELSEMLRKEIPSAHITLLDQATDGQTRTCLLGLEGADMEAPLTIGACDNGLAYNPELFSKLMDDPTVDFIVWTVRGYPGAARQPEMYGWVAADRDGEITGVSVKKPLATPAKDPVVTGAFTFKKAADFVRAAERMIAQNRAVNGEFYVDECINDAIALGLRGVIFDVDAYLCWGTPDDLRTYQYWR